MQFVVDQPLDETKEPNRRVDENTQLHVNDETPIEEIVCFLILSTDTHRPDTRTYSPYQVPQATIQNAIAEAKAGRFTREMLFHRSNGMVRAQAEQVSDRVLTVFLLLSTVEGQQAHLGRGGLEDRVWQRKEQPPGAH
jgi:hypothetical protein